MIQSGERVASGSLRYRFTSVLRYKAGLLAGEVLVGSPDLGRVSLVASALGLQTIVLFSPGHFRPATNAFFAIVVTLGTLAALAAAYLGTSQFMPQFRLPARRGMAGAGLLILATLSSVGIWQGITVVGSLTSGPPYSNDGAVMDLFAAGQVVHHRNPYIRANIVRALAAIDAPATTTTPLMDGQFRGARAYPPEAAIQNAFNIDLHDRPRTIPPEFESKYNYPAGSFLFILPFVWGRIHDLRFLYLLAIAFMGFYLWLRMPRSVRLLAPLIILSNVPLIVLARGGQPDPLYGAFLMLGFAEWNSPWVSPLALGVAAGTKQLAWFFLPFYFILSVRQFGWQEALRRMGIVTGVFLLMNGPFILQSPSAYIESIAGPMSDPMFPIGIGAIALFVANVVPMMPKLAFTIAETVAWGGSAVAGLRGKLVTPATAMVLGALPLFFAWRSLVSYFYLAPVLALAVYFATRGESARET